MAKISLRAYLHEIEELITKDQLEEAISHCQHILQMYPKLLAAYRLLGKAYLDGQRYADAADVFLRVLSAAPDDFTSHVGMSVIREDEGNLNAALWHMERAFEVQPSNGAIQGELRRLYGRRDGVEPPKIRMTRGALARMYARGNLFQQAIAELRAALAEDPQRPDLQVLLARMYFMVGQRVEAVDTCSALIKRLPFCLEANRLLSHILPETGRKEDSQIYAQRVGALDPYLVYAKPGSLTGNEVAENIVMVDRTEHQRTRPAMEPSSQPTWATSLGVSVDQFSGNEQESMPEWLTGDARAVDQPDMKALPEKADGGEEAAETLIPDWMKQAGWKPGTGEGTEGQTFDEQPLDEDEGDGEIAPGMVPDWLKSMAPSGVLAETPAEDVFPEKKSDEEEMPWLQEKTPGASDTIINWLGDKQPAAEPEAGDLFPADQTAGAEIPDWLKEMEPEGEQPAASEPGLAEAMPPEETAEAGIPDWLKEMEPEGEQPIPTEPDITLASASSEPAQPSETAIPDWLTAMQSEGEQPAAEAPSWDIEEPTEEVSASPDEVPDWMKEPEQDAQPAIVPGMDAGTVGETELPDWMAEPEQDSQPTVISEAEAEILPEAELPASDLPAQEADIPDWLKAMQPEVPQDISATGEEEGLFSQTLAPVEVLQDIQPETPVAEAETPGWVQEIQTGASEAASMQNLDDAEAGLAWLESLAAKQGVPEEELTTNIEERPVETPDWIKQVGSAPEQLSPEQPAATEMPEWTGDELEIDESVELEPEGPAEPAEEIPEWLKAMAVDTPAQAVVEEPPVEAAPKQADLPDWLRTPETSEIEAESEQPLEPEAEIEIPAEPAAPAMIPTETSPEELPDWLRAMETGEPEAELELPVEAKTDIEIPVEPLTPVLEAAETPAEELPDWLRAMEAEGGQAEVEVPDQAAEAELAVPVIPGAAVPSQAHATAPDLTDPEAALAWLESLAAKQGVPETELTTQPEDRPSEAPEWVQDAAALTPVELEIPAAAEEAVPVEVEQPVFEAPKEPAPLPEWLEEMASEAEEVVEIPAPVEEIIVPIETAETEPVEIELATEPISPEITPAEQPVDAALAWLESLAAKQGAPQQELVSKPEDRPVDAPAWATKQEIAEPAAVEPAGQESVERGFDEIKEAEAAAEAIIRAAAQTGTLVMPPSEITGVDVPVHKPEPVEPQPEIIEEPTPAAEEPSFVPPPVEIPEWISKAAESPVGEPWTPPQEAAPEEHAEPQVNLNTSGLVDLESLPGIGFIMAQNILNYREEHGQFKSIEDLANVPGVTPELVGEIRDRLTVEEPEVQAAPAAAPITTSGSERELIQQARTAMSGGNQEAALEIYSGLIKKNAAMDDVIYDLNQALRNQPKEPALWQLLGDAYMYSDKLQEALDAYSKAEEFIR